MNDKTPEKPHIKIGVNVFLIRDNKILFGRRIGKTGYSTWCLPGGHLEYGESTVSGAKRELEEETGIKVQELEFLHIINDPHEDRHYIHINFLVKDFEGEPKVMEPDKFSEWKWFAPHALPDPIFDGHKNFVPTYINKKTLADAKSQPDRKKDS